MSKHIELIARAIVIDKCRILVCQRKGTSYWALPGGHIEWGESAEGALRRELREECGLKSIAPKLWIIHENRFGAGRKETHEIVFAFHVKPRESKAALKRPRSPESKLTLQWIPLADCLAHDVDVRPYELIAAISRHHESNRATPSMLSKL